MYTDIFRTWMDFLPVNVTFYDAVNMIHDVIITANPFQYTAKFLFVGVRNNKTQHIRLGWEKWYFSHQVSKINNSTNLVR